MKTCVMEIRVFGVIAALAFAAFTAQRADAQAMIGYGINAGRAGAMGAAAGTGAAGIFTKLSRTTEEAEGKAGSGARGPEFAEDDLKPTVIQVKTGQGEAAGGSTVLGGVTTKSGMTISGLPRSSYRQTSGTRTARVREIRTEPFEQPAFDVSAPAPSSASAPAADQPAADPEQEIAEAEGEKASTDGEKSEEEASDNRVSARAPAAAAPAGSIVGRPRVIKGAARRSSEPREEPARAAAPQPSEAEIAKAVGIEVGEPVEDLVLRFGVPAMTLTGVIGEGYTAKYIFRTPDGGWLTVYVLNGKVTSVKAVSPFLPLRAAID